MSSVWLNLTGVTAGGCDQSVMRECNKKNIRMEKPEQYLFNVLLREDQVSSSSLRHTTIIDPLASTLHVAMPVHQTSLSFQVSTGHSKQLFAVQIFYDQEIKNWIPCLFRKKEYYNGPISRSNRAFKPIISDLRVWMRRDLKVKDTSSMWERISGRKCRRKGLTNLRMHKYIQYTIDIFSLMMPSVG